MEGGRGGGGRCYSHLVSQRGIIHAAVATAHLRPASGVCTVAVGRGPSEGMYPPISVQHRTKHRMPDIRQKNTADASRKEIRRAATTNKGLEAEARQ